MKAIRHQEAHRYPNIPFQEEEWNHDTGEQDLRHRSN